MKTQPPHPATRINAEDTIKELLEKAEQLKPFDSPASKAFQIASSERVSRLRTTSLEDFKREHGFQ